VIKSLENISREKYFMTDKGKFINNDPSILGNNYWEIYDNIFGPLQNEEISLLEFGFGANGHCLETFAEFFTNAKDIIGADYNQEFLNLKFQNSKIKTFFADQDSISSLKKLASDLGDTKFDIIIDDGSHWPIPVRNTFEVFFDLLKDDGLYVIEDTYPLIEEIANGKSNLISELHLAVNEDPNWWRQHRNIDFTPIKKSIKSVYACLGLTIIRKGKHISRFGG
jgi:SAM-dependent methyltransferase